VVVVLPWVPPMATVQLQAHQLGQHLGAAHHRHAAGARGVDLRIVRLDRGGDDDDRHGPRFSRLVADADR
jgi:hypothetical protein